MDIVEELRQDREAGAKRLESEYRAGLLAMARRLCSDLSDADELVNRTFAAVVAGIDDYLEQSAFFGWMCRIMINLNSADRRRRSDRDVTYPGDLPETPDDAAHEAIYRDVDASILRDAINTLPKEMKEAIVMHYLMEQPVARIAKFLALPVSTVKWRIHCARVELTRRRTSSAKRPGVKAVLLALALTALTAVGAVGVAAIRSAAEPAAKVESSASSQPVAESEPASEEHQATEAQPAAEEPPISAEPPETAAEVAVAEPLISQEQEEQSMNKNTRPSILAAALAAALPVASAFGADAGNFVWNGGFEESYIYWANGIGNSNPYSLRYSEYGDINGIEARLEHWTGTGGIADKDASTAPKPNDASLCSGERYLTIYRLQYVEQTLELPAAGTYEVSFRHCMRSGNSGHKLLVSLIDELDTKVFSQEVTPGTSANTYTGTAMIAAAGRYRLRLDGTVDVATLTCIDDVSVVLKDAASPFGAVDLKLPRHDRVLVKVRPLDYGQGDDLTQVDYRIAKHGQSFVPDWTAISAGLAKETEFAYLVTGLEIDTEYDLEVRFSAAGENFVAAKSFRTTKELLVDGGFDELPDFLSVSASLYKNVVDCNDCPWSGTGEVANRARASGGNISPSTTYAKDLITSNVYAFIWKDKDLKQSITVPANGTYKVSFKYAASPNFSRDHSTAVEVVSEGGVTNTLFVESIENGDYALHQCEREVTLPAGNMTFQLRGIPPDGIAVATCYDDISLQFVEANGNPALSLSTSGEGIDRVTLDLNLSARGAPDAIVDIAIAFAPTNQPLGAYYEPILSGLNALGNYSTTIAGLDSGTTYACRLRVRNNLGGEIFVDGKFSTARSAGASIIGNGGFEEGTVIASGNVGDLYDNNGVWPATTTVWKVNAVKAVYNNGISKPNTFFTPNATFTLGGYSAFIWKEGSFEQDIVVPRTGRYRLGFRYGLASNYSQGINISAEITQNGNTSVIWSANNVTSKTTQLVPEETFVNLVRGPATFTIRQTINSTASTAGCYDDITLIAQDSEWVNEVVVASQNPAVTGGMKPAPQVYVDPAAGWATTFRAEPTWTDPESGDKYTCTGWKLYRNGALVDQKALLDCAYVHPAGADDRIVWGWKPWAPSDKLLGGQGFFIRVF